MSSKYIKQSVYNPSLGKIQMETETTRVSDDNLSKVKECIEGKEPFGLESPGDGMVVFLPAEQSAAWYSYVPVFEKKAVLQPPTAEGFAYLITTTLTTHPNFVGPLMVHKFVLAVKILTDERERNPPQLILDPSMPLPAVPRGPLETGRR